MKTHLDLFSGIGGFALAAGWAGFQTIGFSEVDPYCCKLLAQNFPGVKNYGDITKHGEWAHTVGPVDLLTGGFPCQPWSLAGKRRGAEDDRHLWPAMLAVIATVRPAWVLGENVPGILGVEFDKMLAGLESKEYSVQPIIVPACGVDAPHIRSRVWILANSDRPRLEKRQEQSAREECAAAQRGGDDVPDAQRILGPARWSPTSRQAAQWWPSSEPGGHRWISEAESGVCRVVDGIPNRIQRLKGLGNSIVPHVAYEIIRSIPELYVPGEEGK